MGTSVQHPKTQRWWESPRFALALVLLSVAPLLWPDIPPLTDLPGHMGRYRVQLDLDTSAALRAFYGFEWAAIGNLGVDLLVAALAPLTGLEAAVKLIVCSIPPMTVAGFLWTAREAHGRIPPAAAFAAPLAYGYPFHFGFVNFALSMALAFCAFGLWLTLARRGRYRLRAVLFVPLGLALWTAHVFGWAVLGVLAGSAGIVRQRGEGRGWLRSAWRAFLHGLPLAPPLVLMLLWRSGDVGGETGGWFDWAAKVDWLAMALRDRWLMWDAGGIALLALVLAALVPVQWRLRSRGLGLSPSLGLAAVLLALIFASLPRILFGSAYADMRLAPFAIAVALLAIGPGAWGRWAGVVAIAALGFFVMRTAGTATSYALHDRAWDAQLAAIDTIPEGARLASFVPYGGCTRAWQTPRFDHLPSMALVRRRAFANDQWEMPGAQLLTVRYRAVGAFAGDPSQFVVAVPCGGRGWRTIDQALAHVPRAAFDYIWLIDPPAYDARLARGLRPVWRSGTSVLFRVER